MINIKPSKYTALIILIILICINILILVPILNSGTEIRWGLLFEYLCYFSILNLGIYFFSLRIYKNITLNDDTLIISFSYLSWILKPFIYNLNTMKEVSFFTINGLGKFSSTIRIKYFDNSENEKIKVFSYRLSDKKIELKLLFDTLKKKGVNIMVDDYVWEPNHWSEIVSDN